MTGLQWYEDWGSVRQLSPSPGLTLTLLGTGQGPGPPVLGRCHRDSGTCKQGGYPTQKGFLDQNQKHSKNAWVRGREEEGPAVDVSMQPSVS